MDADVTVLNEPFTGLDSDSIEALLALISELKDKGKAFMIVSHQLDELFRIADRVYVLSGSRPLLRKSSGGKRLVRELFNSIAERYDLANRLISLNLDCCWRRRTCEEALEALSPAGGGRISVLDVACGTGGDMLRCLKKKLDEKGICAEFYGLDCSENMLEVAKKKVPFARLVPGFAEEMPFDDESFDFITVAFGVRNFFDRRKAIGELYRVLKPDGVLAVLEFSRNPSILGKLAWFYTERVVPLVGGV
ncbi:ubiquinone/menaquinone biosynthesis methyltransferase [Thermococcus peptonophilus]|uniref:ubiquinone/menaquinone biosynthesis methyltransferase n=1 Tax=Thermococcus peptonophilus TaxID=53952 RepID=UPI000AD13644